MKKHLLALAALATVSGVAVAQNVTVYGFLDAGVYQTSNGSSTTGKSMTTMANGGGHWFPSMLGFTGTEDIGGGLKANFNLQSSLMNNSGAVGDGVTDDTEAINRALFEVYCRTASPSAKKILYFPAGKYKVSDGINVPSDATIKGEGINNTIITQTANPKYVSYVMTTADNKQQIGAQIGYNGASLRKP